jgi:hypothetical protein
MLAMVTLLYIAGTWIFFPDFIHIILPESIQVYAGAGDISTTYSLTLQYLAATAIMLLMPAINVEQKRLTLGIMLCGVIALIPFVMQGRGYYYHLIPAVVFLWLALGLRIQSILAGYASPRLALACGLTFMTALTWRLATNPLHPTEREYASLPLAREAAGCGHPHCSFLIFAPGLDMIHQIANAAGAFHASRMPSFWLLPSLVIQQNNLDQGSPAKLTQEQIDMRRSRLAHIVTEDIMRYQPPLIMLMRFKILKDGAPFDFVSYFSSDKDFKRIWQNYRRSGTQTIRLGDYIPRIANADPNGAFEVDIYRLRTNKLQDARNTRNLVPQ